MSGVHDLGGEVPEPGDIPGDLVSFHTIKGAVRRRRRLWLCLALVGLIIGLGFHEVVPRKYSAVTDLYLVYPSGTNAQQEIADDASVLQTRAVAAATVHALHLSMTPSSFLAKYRNTTPSNSVMAITVTAPSASKAVHWADALAQQFLAFRAKVDGAQVAASITGTQAQVTGLNAQVKKLSVQIGALGGTHGSSSELTNLADQQASDSNQISTLEGQIQQDKIQNASVDRGSRVLDPAEVIKVSAKRLLAEDGIAGLIAGLFIGLLIVVVGATLSDRPRWRSDVAAALDMPVELSIPGVRRARRKASRQLRSPGPGLTAAVDRLERRIATAPGGSLAVVSVESSPSAAAAAALLVGRLARAGRSVAVADLAPQGRLASLIEMRSRGVHAGQEGEGTGAVRMRLASTDPAEVSAAVAPRDRSDATVILVEVDPSVGTDHLEGWAADAVVFVTAGGTSATRLATAASLLRQAGFRPRSAVLLGADPHDDTSGGSVDDAPRDQAGDGDGGRLAVVVQARKW